jgi:hypothetical protein
MIIYIVIKPVRINIKVGLCIKPKRRKPGSRFYIINVWAEIQSRPGQFSSQKYHVARGNAPWLCYWLGLPLIDWTGTRMQANFVKLKV